MLINSFCQSHICYPRKQLLKICHTNMLPLLSVSNLYGIHMLILPINVFKFTVSMEQFLLKYTELILTISKSSPMFSWMASCSILLTALLFLLLHTLQRWPTLLHLCTSCHMPWWICTATVYTCWS